MAKKAKSGGKICPAGKAWAKELLIHIQVLMQIWQHQNIVKIQTMPKDLKRKKKQKKLTAVLCLLEDKELLCQIG